jgi:Fur family ferric uptake transcriptional regulator
MDKYYNSKLKAKGYKQTNQRQAILDILLQSPNEHLSCEEIYAQTLRTFPDLGQATVYRTLQLFTELGITTKHDFDDGKSRFELSSSENGHNHHHLICLSCGKIEEVNLDLMENLEETVSSKYSFDILNHNVKIYGHCKDCRIGQK